MIDNHSNNGKIKSPLRYFRLKPAKGAKISEISEATAASPVSEDERVNFHIGNPVQDEELVKQYFYLSTGISYDELNRINTEKEKNEELTDIKNREMLQFFFNSIKKASPYLPRGGFNPKKISPLISIFHKWLTSGQQEPLEYDTGISTGKRECIITSGGKFECLRTFFHGINSRLEVLPAKVLLFGINLPGYLYHYDNINIIDLDGDENLLAGKIKEHLDLFSSLPSFLIIGKILSEETRRRLRELSLANPLFFIEMNDSPNHLSLSREAGMKERLLRIFTPKIFSGKFQNLSVCFAAGNSEFIKIIESVHFQIKGTPSSTEAELLTFLAENINLLENEISDNTISEQRADLLNENIYPSILNKINSVAARIENLAEQKGRLTSEKFESLKSITEKGESIYESLLPEQFTINDFFAGKKGEVLIEEFFKSFYSAGWQKELAESFLYNFIKHHPEYSYSDSVIVSGSARTALGLLGFHCGIKEVITYDFSWTYEHCFPSVKVVPLSGNLSLDPLQIINAVEDKLLNDPGWNNSGAVIFNNPHNASGQVFDEEIISGLLIRLLNKNIYVIDDLSYQNVAPSQELKGPKSLKQLTNELIIKGYLPKEKEKYLIVVHSLSKTDSFAGARLAVINIPDKSLREKFVSHNKNITPNIFAIFIAYLFYRNEPEEVNSFWLRRNKIFDDRMKALEEAAAGLPLERNPFEIEIKRPSGSMYPQMIIHKLPAGLSLEWLASGLAVQGIGLIPLSTFARTSEGFLLARKTFRLTLGGTDGADVLSRKTRRVLIDLNRLISEESAKYNKNSFVPVTSSKSGRNGFADAEKMWNDFNKEIFNLSKSKINGSIKNFSAGLNYEKNAKEFVNEFLFERLNVFTQRFNDKKEIAEHILTHRSSSLLIDNIEKELYKEEISDRERKFKLRLFDRTVHPTQMYSIKTDLYFNDAINSIIKKKIIPQDAVRKISSSLIDEYLGLNVSITSADEALELLLDLDSINLSEDYLKYNSNENITNLLSFWGDWDGSTRPSGQGHRLVASALIENVNRLSELLNLLRKYNSDADIDSSLLDEIDNLPLRNKKFWTLLNEITLLTNQLEKRYKSILPYSFQSNKLTRIGRKLHLLRDPVISLWQHNDRLEKRMISMRESRRRTLEFYFSLNKRLRKELYRLLPELKKSISNNEIAIETGLYKNLLNRFILTPRIHQKMITARDQFPIDTTVHNIVEINEISGKYGNPGMVLGLQVSMSTSPEALISLDRKINARKEKSLRENPQLQLPAIWIIPLFEDINSVKNIENYLETVWEYSFKSRHLKQSPQERFSEMICELFIAGSDLSQQVSQSSGAESYKDAKQKIVIWLAKKGLIENVRMKLGSGEPMQRQGGNYSAYSGKPAFIFNRQNRQILKQFLKDSTQKSTEFAISPLRGILSEGDLRTFQSNISEKLRHLSSKERAGIIYHLQKLQNYYRTELIKASEPVIDTRLPFSTRGYQQIERLTIGKNDELYRKFTEKVTENFQQILYGKENDVVGIHVISYFISRAVPNLRDRPAVRPGKSFGENKGQKILEQISEIIPLSKRGSLLRAIGHNQAQTVILGINQLTTGLFRSLNEFSTLNFTEADAYSVIIDRILPRLPVYEILHTLRIYHDRELTYLNEMEKHFPAGNSAFLVLREDIDSMYSFIGLIQKELLRQHGINVNEFFEGNKFRKELLVTLRPDLAVLMQPDLFNTDIDNLISISENEIDINWKNEVESLLIIPEKISRWREEIWNLIKKPISRQVESFVELSIALFNLSQTTSGNENLFSTQPSGKLKLKTGFENLFRSSVNDSMKNFLMAAVQYLTRLPENNIEVPVDIIRALKDVERILKIEEQVLSKKEQDLLRFYLLQIARLTGENG